MSSEEGGEGSGGSSGGSDDNDYGEAHVLQLLLGKGRNKTKAEREAAVEYICDFHQYYERIPNQATLTAAEAGKVVAMVKEVSKRTGIKVTPLFALSTPYFNREKGGLMPFSEKTYHVYQNKYKEEEEKQVAAKEEENKLCVVHVYVCMVCACICVCPCACLAC
jgi:undecaprenyl pyrophosphate synthase